MEELSDRTSVPGIATSCYARHLEQLRNVQQRQVEKECRSNEISSCIDAKKLQNRPNNLLVQQNKLTMCASLTSTDCKKKVERLKGGDDTFRKWSTNTNVQCFPHSTKQMSPEFESLLQYHLKNQKKCSYPSYPLSHERAPRKYKQCPSKNIPRCVVPVEQVQPPKVSTCPKECKNIESNHSKSSKKRKKAITNFFKNRKEDFLNLVGRRKCKNKKESKKKRDVSKIKNEYVPELSCICPKHQNDCSAKTQIAEASSTRCPCSSRIPGEKRQAVCSALNANASYPKNKKQIYRGKIPGQRKSNQKVKKRDTCSNVSYQSMDHKRRKKNVDIQKYDFTIPAPPPLMCQYPFVKTHSQSKQLFSPFANSSITFRESNSSACNDNNPSTSATIVDMYTLGFGVIAKDKVLKKKRKKSLNCVKKNVPKGRKKCTSNIEAQNRNHRKSFK